MPYFAALFPTALVAGALLSWACTAHADVEVVPLRHRTVEQVMPVLRPLMEPGGALSGMQNQLIIRASPANIAELKRVLASIDTRPRRLLVSVRQEADESVLRHEASVRGTVRSGRVIIGNEPAGRRERSGASVHIGQSQSNADESIEQRVQVIEGGIASISIGQSLPVPGRTVTHGPAGTVVSDSVAYRDVTTGFEVMPRLAGERVMLDINPRRESAAAGGGTSVQRASSSVTGRLGEWIELGGASMSGTSAGTGLLSRSQATREGARRIWVRVDALE
jgi:hypothetical protein